MGTPIRLNEVLDAVQASRSHAKYLDGDYIFAEYLLDILTADKTKRETRHTLFSYKVYDLPMERGSTERCFPLAVVERVRWRRWRNGARRSYIYRQELLMTLRGELLVWDWFAQRKRNQFFSDKKIFEYVIRSKIWKASPAWLSRTLARPEVAAEVVARLKGLFMQTAAKRRGRLVAMDEVTARLVEVERLHSRK